MATNKKVYMATEETHIRIANALEKLAAKNFCGGSGNGSGNGSGDISENSGGISFNKTVVSLNENFTEDEVFIINPSSHSALVALANGEGIDASIENNRLYIRLNEGANIGNYSVDVYQVGGTFSGSKSTINVSVVENDATIEKVYPSLAFIREALNKGSATTFMAGDLIPITFTGTSDTYGWSFDNELYYAMIIGVDHNIELESEGKSSIHFQLFSTETTHHYLSSFFMQERGGNGGGWEQCHIRTLCQEFLNVFPEEWKNNIATITKYTDNVGTTQNMQAPENVTATTDKIFLLSIREVGDHVNATMYVNTTEWDYQQQYDYYKAGNSAKRSPLGSSTANNWWLRSPTFNTTRSFAFVANNGMISVSANSSGSKYGFSPCFAMVAD